MERDVAAHGRAIDDLAQALRRLPLTESTGTTAVPAKPGPTPVLDDELVPAWLAVTEPAIAIRWLNELTLWVPRVWFRFQGARLPACWPWHPAVVSELLVAQHFWLVAIAPGQSVAALAGWHDRWRPGAMTRTGKVMTGCERGRGCHVDIAGHHFRFDLSRLEELAEWWALGDNPHVDDAPGLTPEARHEDGPSEPLGDRPVDRHAARVGRR